MISTMYRNLMLAYIFFDAINPVNTFLTLYYDREFIVRLKVPIMTEAGKKIVLISFSHFL